MKVDIEKGSGYFHIIESRPGIVDLKYAEKKKQIQVRLKKKIFKMNGDTFCHINFCLPSPFPRVADSLTEDSEQEVMKVVSLCNMEVYLYTLKF